MARDDKRRYTDDDGRTIADMSGVEPQPMLIPRIRKRRDRADFVEPDSPSEVSERPWDTSGQFNREERRAAVGGALAAALLIALAFLVGGALLIWAMTTLW